MKATLVYLTAVLFASIGGCGGHADKSVSVATRSAGGGFFVHNGQIIGPDGNPFIARGLNLYDGQMSSACSAGDCSPLLSLFPKLNMIRLNCFSYQPPSAYQSFIDALTSRGVVVELEDHTNNSGNAGGSAGTVFTGQQLTDELNWYSAIASAYAGNPYVWFGTDNEPSENPSVAALSTWQRQTYDAVRNSGSGSIVMVEMNCWQDPNSCAAGYTSSLYSSMSNIVWDMHYYGWLVNFSTDQNAVNQDIAAHAAAAQQLTGADGVVPILIGEYGNSTDGTNLDADGMQVVAGVQESGFGSTAWHFWSYAPQDNVTDGNNNLTSPYGTAVAAFIAAGSGPVLPSPGCTESPNDSVVTSVGPTLCDGAGNVWAIAGDGTITLNGGVAPYSANVIALAYVNGSIWQKNASQLWWQYVGGGWAPVNGTSTSPLPVKCAESPNDSVATGVGPTLCDGAGNVWAIAGACSTAASRPIAPT
ncbi:MAG TPA: cellulase family glycosylhydrolase [Polyangia bacterium]|jgi:hypothetical protein|nr:cellulase family glycosylhydrolase [Polyangia bacterium]